MNKSKALLATVAEDLRYLHEEWDEKVTTASLRISSGILRRLLLDGTYGRAWRAAGFLKEPVFLASDLDENLKGVAPWNVEFAMAGGATYAGVTLAAAMHTKGLYSDGGTSEPPPFRDWPLSQFLESRCMVVQGVSLKRRRIIQYVTNKTGGVHLDEKRSLKDLGFLLLDHEHSEIFGHPAVYFELLSVGQAVAAAEDTKRFLEKV